MNMIQIVRSIIGNSRQHSAVTSKIGRFSVEVAANNTNCCAHAGSSSSQASKKRILSREIKVSESCKKAKVSALCGASQIVCQFEQILTNKVNKP
ncbi:MULTISPECIES: hypothetical protein [Candidatus Ichthyocystis]|uniref:Uncharacterized protein n=1 Tax=Candidatus Ichthyocystis hellenicum TaxID=1561003 RepID=A0A0S4M1G4_9BURK|nr:MULTISPECIES: hypothetical protein [Ichthyocystis]CUT17609.1 hypothetical protein Ark11_0783 [Candidatus Ichthyocystis hellenicum]